MVSIITTKYWVYLQIDERVVQVYARHSDDRFNVGIERAKKDAKLYLELFQDAS